MDKGTCRTARKQRKTQQRSVDLHNPIAARWSKAFANAATRLSHFVKTRSISTADQKVHLRNSEIWSATPERDSRLICHDGVLWITQSGDADDIFLRAGETFCPDLRTHVVVSVLSADANFTLKSPSAKP